MRADARVAIAFVLTAVAGCAEAPPGARDAGGFVGSVACATCHPDETARWRQSDHAHALADASDSTVLGDFQDAVFDGPRGITRFFLRDGRRFVSTEGPDGRVADFPVVSVLGLDPLQQLVLELPDGHLQAFHVAWDARPDSVGGQRWFDLYPDDPPAPGDPLHWTGREQNAATRCIECHVTGYRADVDPETCAAQPTWREGTVACEACHGPGAAHVTWARRPESARGDDPHVEFAHDADRPAAWAMDPETGIARRVPPRSGDPELDTCMPCHSRRTPLVDPAPVAVPEGDAWRVALLDEGLYWPDGQVRDEVYEYGSFLQSRMHQAGVTCSDCHDPHSGRTIGEGNTLCARCHLPARFDVPEHTMHAPGSAGSQCVACHMPTAVFMGVDVRHDHSIRVPRPDLSIALGVPNACAACHADRGAEWAAAACRGRFGPPAPHPWADAIRDGRERATDAGAELIAVAADTSRPAIVRATAVQLLLAVSGDPADAAVRAAAVDPDALVRRAAAEALESRPTMEQVGTGLPLTSDPVRSVRAEAGRVLAGMLPALVPAASQAPLAAAVEEYLESLRVQADRPEAHLARGILETQRRDPDAARRAYETALRIDPGFAPAAVNLADLLREQGKDDEAEPVLRSVLAHRPDAADAHHALGLLLVRMGRRTEALAELAKAAELRPESARYAYVYAVALTDAGRRAEAREVTGAALERFPSDPDLLDLLQYLDR